jgi:predicted RNA-binding protein
MSLKEIEDEIKRLDLNQETIFLNIEHRTSNAE